MTQKQNLNLWLSFYDQIDPNAIKINTDTSHGMIREEVICSQCNSHLGHLFNDGPHPNEKKKLCKFL